MPDLIEEQGNGETPAEGGDVSRVARHAKKRTSLGYDARSERRALRGAVRRRKARLKLWLVTGPVLVVIAAAIVVLVLFGGPESKDGATSTSTTVAGPVEKGALLLVEQNGDYPVAILLQTHSSGGVVLGVPGNTLLKAGDSFQLLSAVASGDEKDVLAKALGEAFGARAGTIASVSWSSLRAAMVTAGAATGLPAALTDGQEDAKAVAAAVLGMLRGQDAGSDARWEQLPLAGDSSQFRSAVAAFAPEAAGWVSAVVSGDVVQARGATYLNAYADAVKAVLADTGLGADVAVEVRNGSGALGVVEQAVKQLEPLGYKVSAGGNSSDFPGVERTRIETAPGETDTGRRVRAVLGLGIVTENDTVLLGHVVIVLGKDYTPASTGGTGSTSPSSTSPSSTSPSSTSPGGSAGT